VKREVRKRVVVVVRSFMVVECSVDCAVIIAVGDV